MRFESGTIKEGWVCPICGNVNAPWVASCPCGGQRGVDVWTVTWPMPVQKDDNWIDISGAPTTGKRYTGTTDPYFFTL